MYILPFIYMLSVCTCLCLNMELIMCLDVVGYHMVKHMCIYICLIYRDLSAWGHAFPKGGVCDTYGNLG